MPERAHDAHAPGVQVFCLFILMIRFIIILTGLAFLAGTAAAQTLTVRDAQTRAPLESAVIFSAALSRHVVTDARGHADLSGFEDADSIAVQLLGYESAVYSFGQLAALQFRVLLESSRYPLDEVVISASRWDRSGAEVPTRISLIRAEDIWLQQPQTAADLIGLSGEVFIQKSQLGGGSPMIRGFSANRVLISVDGVRMNNAIFRSGNLQNVISLDPLALERTEVLYGPGAIMYGSDAIGGAMNFQTLAPRVHGNRAIRTGGSALLRYAGASHEKTGHADISLGYGAWGAITSLTISDFGDLRTGSHGPEEFLRPGYQTRIGDRDTVLTNPDPRVQRFSGYRQTNFMQKLRFSPGVQWDLQYGFHYATTSDVPRYDRLIERDAQGRLRDGDWHYGPQTWRMHALNLLHEQRTGLYDRMRLTLASQYFGESRHNRNFGSDNLNHRSERVDAWTANLDFDRALTSDGHLNYGMEAVANRVGSVANRENILTGSTEPISTRYPDESYWNSLAAYLGYLHRLNGALNLQVGLRYSYVHLCAPFDTAFLPLPVTETRLQAGALNGSAGLVYAPSADWQINVNLSTGFRAPNIDDIGKVFDSEPGSVIVPNTGLKPEYAWNAEAGLRRSIAGVLTLEITGFALLLQDAMVRREFQLNGQDSMIYDGVMSRVLAIQNAARAQVLGLQANLEAQLPYGLVFTANFTYQNGWEELDEGGTAPLRHAVPWFGVARLQYRRQRLLAELNAVFQSPVAFGQLPPSERSKPQLYARDADGNPWSPGWATLNLKANWQATGFLLLSAGLENLADVRYRPYSSGISAPGRNAIVSLRFSF
jgi:hemoglobin/transferrin/lactoferrin receptor protein